MPAVRLMRPSPHVLRAMARRVVELREKRGYSQNLLAARAGLHPRTLNYLESGTREPSTSTTYDVAKALGTTVEYLWSGEA